MNALIAEAALGARETALLVRWRWRTIRSSTVRTVIVIGAFIILSGLITAANLGATIRIFAAQGAETAAGIFATTWLIDLERNTLGDVGAIALGAIGFAAFFAPFTGSSTLSLAPVEDLHGLRPSRLHRYFDSLLINSVSGIGLLQLLTLTGIASVLTLDGTKTAAIFFAWVIWACLVSLTTGVGWGLELVIRKFGKRVRLLMAAVVLIIVSTAIYFDPAHGQTLFGLGNAFAETLRQASSGRLEVLLLPFAVSLMILFSLITAGVVAARRSLALPLPVIQRKQERRSAPIKGSHIRQSLFLLLAVIWRTPESRRPILAVVIFGIPGMATVQLSGNVETGVMLAVPMAIALAWGVNLFAVIGQGMSWLSSQPKLLSFIPPVAALLQAFLTMALVTVLWLTALIFGNSNLAGGGRLITGATVAGFLAAVISQALSIYKPIRARLSGRGDALVPPLTALGYLVMLMMFAVAPAASVAALPASWRLVSTLGVVVLSVILLIALHQKWGDQERRSRVVATVASA